MLVKKLIPMLLVFIFIRPAVANLVLHDGPHAEWTGNNIKSWTQNLTVLSVANEPTPVVKIQYTDSAGRPVGDPVTVTPVRKKGSDESVITVPPPSIPMGAEKPGHHVLIYEESKSAKDAFALSWTVTKGVWSTDKAIVVEPVGLPGTFTQHWFILDPENAHLSGSDDIFGERLFSVVNSGFDLSYSLISGDLYNVSISGSNSFIELVNNTYTSFEDGSIFGTMNIGAGATSGNFDFFAIGLSGLWSYDPLINHTKATGTTFSSFNIPTISGEIPEPSILWLFGLALSILWFDAVRRGIFAPLSHLVVHKSENLYKSTTYDAG